MQTDAERKAKRAALSRKWKLEHPGYDKRKRNTEKDKCQALSRYWSAPEVMRARSSAYYHAHKEAILAKMKLEYDPVKAREKNKEFRVRHGDEIREKDRNKYKANPKPKREAASRWYLGNKDVSKARSLRYRARKFEAYGHISKEDLVVVAGVLGASCLKCGAVERVQWDHVIPLSLGGSHLPLNLQPLCCSCNPSKGNRSRTDYRTKGQIMKLSKLFQLTLF